MRLIPRPVTAGPCFTDQLGRREFVTAASAIAGAALLPAVATANRRPARPADGTVVLFQGDSITEDRKSTRLNSSHLVISYAVFCLKKKKITYRTRTVC